MNSAHGQGNKDKQDKKTQEKKAQVEEIAKVDEIRNDKQGKKENQTDKKRQRADKSDKWVFEMNGWSVDENGVCAKNDLGSIFEDDGRRISKRMKEGMELQGDEREVFDIIENNIFRDYFCIKDAGVSPSGVAKGNGVFAKQWIPQGLICINYEGDFITDRKVIDSRRDQYTVAEAESWYILTFSYVLNSGDSSRAVRGWYDAHPEEYKHTFGRSMNHSREDPNLIGRLKFFKGQPRLLFETLRPIKEGEELVWDYGDKGLDAPEWMRV